LGLRSCVNHPEDISLNFHIDHKPSSKFLIVWGTVILGSRMSDRANMWAFPTPDDFNLKDSVHQWVLDVMRLRTTLDREFKAMCDLLASNVNVVQLHQQAVLAVWAQMQAETNDMYFKMTRDNYFVQAMPTNEPPIDPEQAIVMVDLSTIPTESLLEKREREFDVDEFFEEHASLRQRLNPIDESLN
tara:strand:+ start:976 stop:1536 length:561 start_codon:yes stop_codon:yes gene_type:complete